MNNGPVKAITFEQVYKLSKQHAQKFGWSKTNADIRFVAQTSSVPALGDLNSTQHAELHAKWTLDLEGDGHPPTVSYEKFKETVARYASRFGHDAMRDALTRYGGQPWAPNIKHAKRQYVIDCMERDIADDIERARRVAGKQPVINIVNTINPTKERDARQIAERMGFVDVMNPDHIHAATRTGRYFPKPPESPAVEDARSRALRRGPIHAADGIGVLRRGGLAILADGRRGRIAACEGTEYQCLRLVLIMDDCTTRVISGLITRAQVRRVVYDGGHLSRKRFATGGIVGERRQGSGEWIVDALRAFREN